MVEIDSIKNEDPENEDPKSWRPKTYENEDVRKRRPTKTETYENEDLWKRRPTKTKTPYEKRRPAKTKTLSLFVGIKRNNFVGNEVISIELFSARTDEKQPRFI